MKILNTVNSAITTLAALALAVMTVLVLLQIFYRYVLDVPFPESQELSVYAMVFVVMLGSTIAVRKKTHIAVEFVVDKLPAVPGTCVRIVAYLAIIVFFALLMTQGWNLTLRSMLQRSPTTGIPVGYIVASIPVSSFISILYVCEHLFSELRRFKKS